MNRKAATLLAAFEHLPPGAFIVEIGCIRFPDEIPSDGYSTVYLARAAQEHGWTVASVDHDPRAVTIARERTLGLPVTVFEDVGREWLARSVRPIDGLFLDGAANAEQALWQYEAATLAPGAVIVVDDVQEIAEPEKDPLERGKGDLLLDRLAADGYTVEIVPTEPDYLMAVAR